MNVNASLAGITGRPGNPERALSARQVVLLLGALVALGWLARLSGSESPVTASIVVNGAALAIGVVPGALIILAWPARLELSILEFLGTAVAISLGLTQLLTVAALTLHLPPDGILLGLAAIAVTLVTIATTRSQSLITWSYAQLALGTAIGAVSVSLYLVGARYELNEDAIHVAIVRRLTFLQHPSINNVYFLPDFIYTYPFPGTHYFMALVSRVSDLDPLFVYHKLRMFWGASALVLLYSCARRIFQSERLAMASALVATVLSGNGSFGAVDGYYWGQLAPFSHASDVAMGVLLPALILGALWVFQARERRELVLAAATAGGLFVMLLIVHIREAVQFVVYLLAFTVALFAMRADRTLRRRALTLLAVAAVATPAYVAWQGNLQNGVADLVSSDRRHLLQVLQEMGPSDLATPAIATLSDYMPGFQTFFYGWNPIVLLGAVAPIWWLRSRPAVLMLGAGILSYAIIVRIAPVAVLYVYATYFEILFTPVRNVIFFVHLLAGVSLYVLSIVIARQRAWRAAAYALVSSAVLVMAFSSAGRVMTAYNDLLWIPLLALFGGAALATMIWKPVAGHDLWLDTSPGASTVAVMSVLLASIAVVSWNPQASPLRARNWSTIDTPGRLFAERLCREEPEFDLPDLASGPPIRFGSVLSCRPSQGLIEYAQTKLPVEAVLAVDKFDGFSPAMYLPQQMDTWPGPGDGLIDKRELFATYFRYYDAAVAKYGDQPFFNARDTRDERLAFARGLGVTHVLLNPRTHAEMTRVLAQDPDAFRRDYDDGEWAVYQVIALR